VWFPCLLIFLSKRIVVPSSLKLCGVAMPTNLLPDILTDPILVYFLEKRPFNKIPLRLHLYRFSLQSIGVLTLCLIHYPKPKPYEPKPHILILFLWYFIFLGFSSIVSELIQYKTLHLQNVVCFLFYRSSTSFSSKIRDLYFRFFHINMLIRMNFH